MADRGSGTDCAMRQLPCRLLHCLPHRLGERWIVALGKMRRRGWKGRRGGGGRGGCGVVAWSRCVVVGEINRENKEE